MEVKEVQNAIEKLKVGLKDWREEIKTDVQSGHEKMHSAFHEFKAEMAKGRGADAEKLAKIETDIAKYDKANADFIAKLESERKSVEDIEKRLNRREVGTPGEREARGSERKATWFAFCRYGHPDRNPDAGDKWERERKEHGFKLEAKALNIADDTSGGFLAPPEYIAELIKAEVLFSPVREVVGVRKTSNKSVQQPKRTQTAAAVWIADGSTRSETQNPAYGLTEIPTHELTAEVYISFQDLEDSAFDLSAELTNEFAEQFAVSEGAAVVGGNGVGKPFGFTDAGQAVPTTSTGTSASIASATGAKGDALINLAHAVKTPYAVRGRWLLSRKTLGSVRKLADTQGRYLWEPSPAVGMPSMILGSPYTEFPDMPDEAANSLSVGFGDWQRGYKMVDRLSLSVMRDPYSKASSGQVKFLARRRVGGQVVLAEAIRLLKCI
jgi:HK97 family phage major capsid protein